MPDFIYLASQSPRRRQLLEQLGVRHQLLLPNVQGDVAEDAEGIEAETNQRMRDEYPGLYDRINRDRNLAWLPVLQERLDRGGNDDDVLVVVGALHLLGDDGLVHLLREAGYTVERL